MDSGLRHLATYVLIVGSGLVMLLLVVWAGGDIAPTPEAPELATVGRPAAACLGPRVASVQSGVFVDLHVPGGSAGDGSGAGLGGRIARGRIDRDTGQATLIGTCAPGTAVHGEPFRAAVRVHERRGEAVLTGRLRFDGAAVPVAIEETPATDADGPGGRPQALTGSELTGRLFLAVAVVIVVSRVMGSLFRWIRQPRVVGEIVAGILLGPSLLGHLFPEAAELLFPPEVIAALRILAQFGLVFFMFLIGLELDLTIAARSGRVAVLVSHVSIVVPFVLGAVGALVIYPLVGSGDFVSFTLFMGAAMAITAFPVLARILTDTGLQRTRLGTLAITCAGVDDVTAWCILSAVVAVVRSHGPGGVVRTVGLTLLFVLVMLRVVRPLVHRFTDRPRAAGSPGTVDPVVITGILVALLLAAWMAEVIGIHAIFGAFLMGIAMPRRGSLATELTARLSDITGVVLLPIFFAVVGLSTRLWMLDRPVLWAVTALIMVLAIVGKWVGSALAARASGLPWREATALGVLMNARGLTEIVILTIGLSLGVISPALFTIMVLMALVTTFMATPLVLALHPVGAGAGAGTGIDERAEGGDDEDGADEGALLPVP
jgi:Kef-type K+ transport system membrane component KefB